ncbi:hypothetical protein R1N82_28105, partial [Klebsiella sp. 78106]
PCQPLGVIGVIYEARPNVTQILQALYHGCGRLVRPETRVVFLESPGSITMEVHDVPALVFPPRSPAPAARPAPRAKQCTARALSRRD